MCMLPSITYKVDLPRTHLDDGSNFIVQILNILKWDLIRMHEYFKSMLLYMLQSIKINNNGYAVTDNAQKNVHISSHPKDAHIKPGEKVEFTVQTLSPAESYQWQFQDKPIPFDKAGYNGCRTNCLTIKKCFPKHKGTYFCIVYDISGTCIASNSARLDIGKL